MAQRKENLNAKQERAVLALMSNPSVEAAAKASGIGRRTIIRWFDEDEGFIKLYRKARRCAWVQALAQLQASSSKAVETLMLILQNDKLTATPRVAACKCILEFARTGAEFDSFDERLGEIEKSLEENARRETQQ